MKRLFGAVLLAALALPALADADDRRRSLRQRAEGGEPAAMFLLAHMLADGEGGPRDVPAAHLWLERAAELDYPEALQELALSEPDPQRADALMRAAAHALAHRAHAGGRHRGQH